jgi:hypothetical protein
MNSNNHPAAYGYQPPSHQRGYHSAYPPVERPRMPEDLLKSSAIQIEQKTFAILLKENERGRILSITENKGGRRNTIIIPSTGLKEFQQLLADMLQASESTPAPKSSPEAAPET